MAALGPIKRLSTQNAIKLLAAAVVGYIAVTGKTVDPLILTALLSALAVTPAPRPEDADQAPADPPTEQETPE